MQVFSYRPLCTLMLRLVLGGIFLWSGLEKIQDSQTFADNIASFRLLPVFLVNPWALGLPPLEILIGTAMIANWKRRDVTLGVVILTTLFLFALIQAFLRGFIVDCGCFGSKGHSSLETSWIPIIRDIALLAASLWLYKESIKDVGPIASSKPTPSSNRDGPPC